MRNSSLRWTAFLGAAALLVPAIIASASSSPASASSRPSAQVRTAVPAAPAPASVLWFGDPSLGPARVFDGLERAPGSITVADDPQGRYGRSFKFETWDHSEGKERCESRGLRRPDGSVLRINSSMEGQTLYLGWRALWAPMPNARGRWLSLFQLHISGRRPGEPGAGPYVLRTLGDGRLHFQYSPPSGSDQHIWSAPLSLNSWNTFVIGFRVSRSAATGWTEFWYNGVQQRFTNGSTRFPGVTLMGTHVNPKWGVYRSGPNSGRAAAYLNQARLGTSYAEVAP
jgi:hypothetical protein